MYQKKNESHYFTTTKMEIKDTVIRFILEKTLQFWSQFKKFHQIITDAEVYSRDNDKS